MKGEQYQHHQHYLHFIKLPFMGVKSLYACEINFIIAIITLKLSLWVAAGDVHAKATQNIIADHIIFLFKSQY